MTPTERDKLKADVLDWCNEVRRDRGLKPRKTLAKGVRGSACECVVTQTVRGGSPIEVVQTCRPSVTEFLEGGGWRDWHTTIEVARFIRAFDSGEFPELEVKG